MLPACSEPWHGLLPLLAHQPHDRFSAAELQTTTSIEVKTKGCGRNHQADHHWHLRHLRHEISWNIPHDVPMMFPSFPNEIPTRSMGNPPNAARCPVSVLPFPFPDQSMALTPSQTRARTVRALWRAAWALAHGSGSRGQKFFRFSYHWIGLTETCPHHVHHDPWCPIKFLKPIQW